MSEILIVARVRLHEYDLPIITDYYFEVTERLATVDGFLGLSVWRDPKDHEAFLVTYEYASVEAAERGLVAVTEVRVLAETQYADFRPADVMRIAVAKRTGGRLSKTPLTACLSLSVRIADPGYGPELVDELSRIFVELSLMPGFLGSVCGTSDVLSEEVLGLVTWTSESAFRSSLPRKGAPSRIELYSRFF